MLAFDHRHSLQAVTKRNSLDADNVKLIVARKNAWTALEVLKFFILLAFLWLFLCVFESLQTASGSLNPTYAVTLR